MGDEDRAESIFAWCFAKMCFDGFSDIYYLVILLCCDGECFHPSIKLFLFYTIFPGFRIPSGSKRALIWRIHSRAGPCSASINFIFTRPTPCSPVAVPPSSSDRSISCSEKASARQYSSGGVAISV